MALNLTRRQARRALILSMSGALLALTGCQMGRGPVGPAPIAELPPVQTQRNRVAVIVPLTGSNGGVGTSISNAARLALSDTGEKTIEINVFDSTGPGGAAAATQRAIAEGNRLILGPLLADDVRAAAPIARRGGVPIIAFSNDEGIAGDGVYIMGFTPDQSISRVVSFAQARGSKRFAALVPTGLYGQRAAQSLLAAARRSGATVAGIESYDRSNGAITAAARRLNARGAFDAVLIGDSGRSAALAAPQIKVGPRKLGTELWATDRTLGRYASLRGAWYAAAPDAQFDRLVVRYRARYGKTPYRLASLGYDSVLLAVRRAREWPIGRAFPARTLVDREGFGGVDGAFRFSREGVAERLLEVRQVTAAGSSPMSPAAPRF